MHKLYLCEGLSPTAWWSLSLPPGSQKAQINDWWVIDLSVLYSFNLGTYLLIQLSMVAWTTSLISVHGNTVPIFLEYILYLCMLFVVVPNLFAAVACHYGIASADREMRLCSMVSCSTSMRIRRSLIEASQDSQGAQGARAESNANAGV